MRMEPRNKSEFKFGVLLDRSDIIPSNLKTYATFRINKFLQRDGMPSIYQKLRQRMDGIGLGIGMGMSM